MILGVDPGATTGWALYNPATRRVVDRGTFAGACYDDDIEFVGALQCADVIVLERPVAHGPTRPQVVDCAWIAGQIYGLLGEYEIEVLTRLDVKKALTTATHAEVQVRNDATAWAALKLLHGGDGPDKKGGPLHGVKSHERAALAVAVAWDLRRKAAAVTA